MPFLSPNQQCQSTEGKYLFLYLTKKLFPGHHDRAKKASNVWCMYVCVAVTVGEHTSICSVHDFTIHPVSVHLPLTRLLASLYILLDEPVEVSVNGSVLSSFQ